MRARIMTAVVLCAPVKHYLTRSLLLAEVGLRAYRAISDGCSNQHRSLLLCAGSRCRRQSGGHALRASEAVEGRCSRPHLALLSARPLESAALSLFSGRRASRSPARAKREGRRRMTQLRHHPALAGSCRHLCRAHFRWGVA